MGSGRNNSRLKRAAKTTFRPLARWLRPLVRGSARAKPVNDWSQLRRTKPVSRVFGFDRGLPIDRYYIESFLQAHARDIHGRVLEIGDRDYTLRFGVERVAKSEVLNVTPGGELTTIVGNLATGEGIPHGVFDCAILTQTFFAIYDVRAAIGNAHAVLADGGVLLATLPGISQISRYDMDRWGDFWRFTSLSAQRLFSELFGAEAVTVKTFGNVLAATAFLHGLASHELMPAELDYCDPDYQLLITVRAVKTGEQQS